jgi:transposase InsO family protein
VSMTGKIEQVEVITSVQRRALVGGREGGSRYRRPSAGHVGLAGARRHGIAPNQLFRWRRLYVEGALSAPSADIVRSKRPDWRLLGENLGSPEGGAGSRRMATWLATQGHVVHRKRVRRLMRLAGLVAIYQRPNTSKPAVTHKIYPYLLGGLSIERVNQVWCSDVTYIPMAKGFLHLVVIMDWVSRAVLAWRLSSTLGAEFCVEHSRKLSPNTAGLRSSIPTRAASSPATISPVR